MPIRNYCPVAFFLVLALWVFGLGTACSDDDHPGQDAGIDARPDAAIPNCTVDPPDPEALLPAGEHPEEGVLLIGGRKITPLGTLVPVGGHPINVKVLPGGEHVVVTESGWNKPHRLWLLDATGGEVLDEVTQDELWFGITATSDGSTLFVGGGGSRRLFVYDYDPGVELLEERTSVDLGTVFVGALELTPDEDRLLVLDNEGVDLLVLDASTLETLGTVRVGDMPYDVKVDAARDQAVVTLWGDSEVVFVDLGTLSVTHTLEVGKNPEALVLSPAGDVAYVVESDSDSFSVVDLASREVLDRVAVDIWHASLRGINPNHITLSADDQSLLVAAGGTNSVEVYDRVSLEHVGSIPTAWYPTGIAASPTYDLLYICNAKGVGAGPSVGPGPPRLMKGNVQVAPIPSDTELAANTAGIRANAERMARLEQTLTCSGEPRVFPVPVELGLPTPIEHVVLLVRENKTYDAQLGDLTDMPEADGDPDLAIYGEWFTPNLHALARQFTSMDNYYVNGEVSLQGHVWLTAVMNNDFFEKTIPVANDSDGSRSMAGYAVSDIGFPEGGFIWGYLEEHDVDFINYGEAVGVPLHGLDHVDQDFPGIFYNLAELDVDKAAYVASRVADGVMPTFTFLLLPNNHTYGSTPGRQTPASMVADNDQGTGMVVDAISHSQFWPRTVIFIVEDDALQGGDHVEVHRSVCLVVSPWARRGYTVHMNHDMAALWKTIFRILGLPPIGLNDSNAALMFDAFTDEPDFTPYTYLERNVPPAVNPTTSPYAFDSLSMDFSKPDQAKGLPRLIWEMRTGKEPPWPEWVELDFELEGED
ncbi:MAG: alkaline phosphatase family protein [Polyangia bacterium]|jgi:DNA-binding beta-propeller fold protein YncE|nr:alkaline phosphatase family protein [Polyangia bacterium]